MDKLNRIKQLIDILNVHNYNYYTLDNPTISDREYDALYDELVALEKETGIVLSNSPTQKVGGEIMDGFKKVKHKTKLYSLDKAQTQDELEKFYNDTQKFTKENNLPKPRYIVTKKFDGLTINSEYIGGNLEVTASRGNGLIGENVTSQSKTIVNLPHHIESNHTLTFHGECLMTKRAFEEYNKKADIPLKNLRNGAAGALRNLNVSETARRKLSVFFYEIPFAVAMEWESYSQKLEFIKEVGLPCAEYKVCESLKEIQEEINNIENGRSELQFDIDGVVIAIDDIRTRELMGYTQKFPKWAIAYKFKAEETTTTLLGVEWNTGRTGKVTPRAIIEPVDLMGATVKYATLNSMDDIRRKGVRIGADVFIRRSNDVIPEILGVVEDSITDETIEIKFPKYCASCESELIQDGVHYFCRNSMKCKPQIVKSIAHYGSRDAMNIDGFSEQTAELFYENGIVKNVLDLYSLHEKKDKIVKLNKFGLKKYNNLIASIEKSKTIALDRFIYGLGISNIGIVAAKDLCKHFNYDLDRIMYASENELLKVKDFGETTAKSIWDYFLNHDNMSMVYNLILHLNIEKPQENTVKVESVLNGLKVYPTGTFANFKKNDLKVKLESLGAIMTGGYSKSLDMLIEGSVKGSSKVDKARLDGVKIVTEEQFLKMIE